MRAFCQCGHQFTVFATRFPHQISCHVCGYKFLVQEDGRTREYDGPVREFNVACSCGQSFHILSAYFPRQVQCHACGNRFAVFDDGNTIGVEPLAPVDSSAIQDDTRPIRPDADAPVRLIDANAVAEQEKALAELNLIDLQWQLERMQFTGICRFLRGFCSMPGLLIGGLLLLFVIALCLIGANALLDIPMGLASFADVSWYFVGIYGAVLAYVLHEMREYDKAELAWQRRRVVVMAKAGVPIDAIPAAVKAE